MGQLLFGVLGAGTSLVDEPLRGRESGYARAPPPPLHQKHQATSSVASSLVKYRVQGGSFKGFV